MYNYKDTYTLGFNGYYSSVAEANANTPMETRYQGRTILILQGGFPVEYWYYDGIADVDLVEKSTNSGSPITEIKKRITVSTTSEDFKTITDGFFSNVISEIVTDNQSYINGVDFTQDTTAQTITGNVISFYVGQVLIAKI